MTKDKQLIKDRFADVYLDQLSLEEVIGQLQTYKDKAQLKGMCRLFFVVDRGYDDEPVTEIWGERLETDSEYLLRTREEEEFRNRQGERERAEYERLKGIYGD